MYPILMVTPVYKIMKSDTFRALRHRNYRIFFIGQGISLIGTWMQQVAMSWLVYRLTQSAFILGVAGFCNLLPGLILFPVTGIVADRSRKRRMILLTQSLSMIQSLTLAVLVLSDLAAIWQVIALSSLLGIINAFDMPARQAFIVEMVDSREDLGNAIALNSSLFNSARLIGPMVAGALIPVIGEGYCFLINAVSYGAVLLSLLQITAQGLPKGTVKENPLKEIADGIKYTFGFYPVRALIMNLMITSFFGVSFMFLLPVFDKDVLGGNAHTLGMMTGAIGLGALAGSLNLARRKKIPGLGRFIAVSGMGLGICHFFFAISDMLVFSLILLVLMGFSIITLMASTNTVIQAIVPDAMRGRVISFYVLSFSGVAPIGSLLFGFIAEKSGPEPIVIAGGAITLLVGLIFMTNLPRIRKMVRPIYLEKGISPK
jgi:MFS family permease